MAYTEEKKNECFEYIIQEITSGKSLRSALSTNGMPSSQTFYIWLEEDENKSKQYACACEMRELILLDEILEIADKQGEDIIHTDSGDIVNHNVIQRNKLQIEARQWYLGKINPKKYGNKIDHTTDGEKFEAQINPVINIIQPK